MTLTEYYKLKSQIVLSAGTSERHSQILNTLKELFEDDINSKRRYEQINTIGKLLNILDVRDIISENNVAPLKKIVRILPNNVDLLKKVSEYEKFHIFREPGNEYASEILQNTSTKEPVESFHNVPGMGNVSKQKKERITEVIIDEIGTFWRDLARNLKIRECIIDNINDSTHVVSSKAAKVLEYYYENKADKQLWFMVLCEALEKSRRKDLSKSVQEIMTMNI